MSDVHALTGAYAVDAVDDIERAHFERHLNSCDDCREEVASLREASALLASSVPVAPPAGLRSEVLADIAAVRPLPPLVAAAAARGRTVRRRLPALVAAAAAVLVIGVGSVVVAPWDNEQPDQTISAATAVFEAPDAESYAELSKDGVSVAIVRSDSLGQAAIRTSGMPALPSGEVYQMWLQKDAKLVSAGLMDQGNGEYILEGDAADASEVVISKEKAGGETQPKGSVVARIEFKQSD